MRSEIMYRDLPGGPLLVKFADEVSLWCLCSKCGMFSKDMFQDSASHVFCSVCIFECSAKKRIHCKHERKDVPVDDMVQAVDVGHVMRDQIVFCPNSKDVGGCAEFCALKDLEGHYLKCAETQITCLSCGSVVKGPDWEHHIRSCPQQILQCRHCAVATPRCRLQTHEQLCYDNPEARHKTKNAVPASDSSNSCSKLSPRQERNARLDSAESNGASVNETQTFRNNVDSDDGVLQCIYCARNVKRKNMEPHLQKCPQNKGLSAVSPVKKLPGNVEMGPDSRNTHTVGASGFPREATSLQNSSALCDQNSLSISWRHFGEAADPPCMPAYTMPLDIGDTDQEAKQETSLLQYGVEVAGSVGAFPLDMISRALEFLGCSWGSHHATTETLQDSDIVPRMTSPSGAANQPQGGLPPWPAEPSYYNISAWFHQFDASLEQNGITNEAMKFPVLLNRMPRSVYGAFLYLKNEPYPYTAAKSAVLNFYEKVRKRAK